MERPTPRIDSAQMRDYMGEIVRMVGRVVQLQPSSMALLETPDHGRITVKLNEDCAITTRFVEVIGQVEESTTLRALSVINFGEDFDLDLYGRAIALVQKMPQLFV